MSKPTNEAVRAATRWFQPITEREHAKTTELAEYIDRETKLPQLRNALREAVWILCVYGSGECPSVMMNDFLARIVKEWPDIAVTAVATGGEEQADGT